MLKKIKKIGLIVLLISTSTIYVSAQEVVNDFQSRYSVGIQYKFNKKWKISATPEIRFDESFNVDRFLIEGKLKYKPFKIITLGATYRFVINYRDVKETQYLNRFGFSATVKKKIKRFEPAFRLQYSNYADDEITDSRFLRYKLSTEYNIKDCKITPMIAAEIFQRLGTNTLLYKMRYTAGADYKINKKNYIGLKYKFDYYKYEYRNRHIISLEYKFKF